MLILAMPGNEALAQDLARECGGQAARVLVRHFPDGESLVRIDAAPDGRDVVFACTLDHPHDKTLPLVFAADAARELGARRVGLVAPYLAYMRQDARFQPGEAISSRSFARLLSSSFDFLLTVDPHLHRWHSLDQIYTLRTQVVPAAPAIAAWLADQVPAPLLVGPDEESAQWVSEVARLAHAPWTVMRKTRQGDREVRVVAPPREPQWSGRTPVLVDDIISTGHTLVAAAQALQAAELGAALCVGVHALHDGDAQARMLHAGIARVASCDSVHHPSNAIALAPLLAPALNKLLAEAVVPAPAANASDAATAAIAATAMPATAPASSSSRTFPSSS
ncbi:ribose-phosphate diphosphokinase [Ramlibacter sp. AN1015]|uniref:ribose-phosphate diphosphokinase n=1 Tax=Ramlibacter sp. AN1015 TaxID=3133428 RepID=UPI0030C3EA91